MEQKKLTLGKLLNVYGNLNEAGYATSLVKEYNRADIKARKSRIKEWDYYYIGNQHYGVALTIDDNSYMGLGSVSVLDFDNDFWNTKSAINWFTNGKTHMPSTSKYGDVHFKGKGIEISFFNDGEKRRLLCKMKNFFKKYDFSCDIEITDEPEESMVIATPFEKKRHFYYNQKINCMRAEGRAVVGGKTYFFDKENSFAVLDWGRGVWTYKNTWYWSSLNSIVNGKKVGFNLGYGFGDTRAATENMIFYDGKAYKVEQVTFHIPQTEEDKDDFMSEWKMTSSDNKVNLTFKPIFDRHDDTNVLVIKSLQHQVFGRFSGTLEIKGQTIEINDLVGFAEKVTNWW